MEGFIALLVVVAIVAAGAAVSFKLDLDGARRELRLERSQFARLKIEYESLQGIFRVSEGLSKLRVGRIVELERENAELGALATLRDRRAADFENENCKMLRTLETIRGLLPIEVNLGEERDG
jgi:hypothetical protein